VLIDAKESLVTHSEMDPRQGFSSLVRDNLSRVLSICLSHLGNLADAEDAAQEVFLRGYRKLDNLREAGSFKSWIDQIARNYCRDVLRGRARRPEASLDEADGAIGQQDSIRADQDRDLHQALARLPEEHRLPLVLFYFEGCDTRALAREMGLSQGGACTRLFRARLALRTLLEREETGHE
jgi:RNA polymerase sigma factor (sigma-70 family)